MATPATVGPPTTASTRRTWAILGLVLLADALDMIDATVTNIAAPTIAAELHGGEGLIKWLGSAYMLAMGVLLVVAGRLGDKYGQRRLFLVGMSGFTIASAVAGLSPNPALLILARGAQGAFGALLIPQGMAIMTKTFSRDMLTKAFALFGPLLGTASVGGPILAGFVIDADIAGLSWGPIFLVNLVLGTLGLVMAVRLLPHDDGDLSTGVDGVGSGRSATLIPTRPAAPAAPCRRSSNWRPVSARPPSVLEFFWCSSGHQGHGRDGDGGEGYDDDDAGRHGGAEAGAGRLEEDRGDADSTSHQRKEPDNVLPSQPSPLERTTPTARRGQELPRHRRQRGHRILRRRTTRRDRRHRHPRLP
ncbi:MAG TPA: MFS transporter [Nonomuraea sp.]|nr:MFS transporter [Nonomuraea sp.]